MRQLTELTASSDEQVANLVKPVSELQLFLKNGLRISTKTSSTPEDLVKMMKNPFIATVRLHSGGREYAIFRRRDVSGYIIKPLAE